MGVSSPAFTIWKGDTVVQLFTVGGLIRGDDTGPSSKSYAQNVGGVVVFLIKVVKSIA